MILDLTGKRCPVIFSAVLFFIFEKFSSTSTGGKCALRWFYCLEKQKLSLERTPPGKKLRFCIRYLWKMKEKPANLNRGVCFSIKWKATCRNWAHLDEEKQFGLKSHLRACCTQPFNCQPLFGKWAHTTPSPPPYLWNVTWVGRAVKLIKPNLALDAPAEISFWFLQTTSMVLKIKKKKPQDSINFSFQSNYMYNLIHQCCLTSIFMSI